MLSPKTFSIRKVILLVMASMLLTVGMVETFRYITSVEMTDNISLLLRENRRIQDDAAELQNLVSGIQRLALLSILSNDEDAFRKVSPEAEKFLVLAEKIIQKSRQDPRLHVAISDLKDTFKDYIEYLYRYSVSAGSGVVDAGLLSMVDASSDALNNELLWIRQMVDTQARKHVDAIQNKLLGNFFLSLLFLLPLPLVVAWAFFFMEKNLTRPFKNIMFFFREQIEGKHDFSKRLDGGSVGEMGELAHGLNSLLENLQQTSVSRNHLLEEITERKKVESDLLTLQGKLADLVDERTEELQDEVAQRQQAEMEQFRAKEELRKSLDYVHTIVNNLPVCVKLIDKDGVLLDINPPGAVIIGANNRKDLLGKNVYDLVVKEDLEEYRRFNESICAGGEGELHFSINSMSGDTRQMASLAVPIPYGENGELVQLGISRDVTIALQEQQEKEKLRDQLRHVQKLEAVGTLAGGIAHDFNNILTGIMGFAELAALDAEKDSRQAKDIAEILNAGMRAKELVSQMLALSRRDDKEFMPHRIQVILKEGVKLLRSSFPASIDIQQDVDVDCKPVLTDPTQIHQVLMNLATNSLHAMEGGGVLTVALHQVEITGKEDDDLPMSLEPGNYVRLEVSDTGAGMDQVTRSRIFEPYFTTKGMEKGTGLGLAMIMGIVQAHGGDIKVTSEPGMGSTFYVYLPCAAENAPKVESIELELPTGCEKIMLVDDEEVNLHMTERVLSSLGYEVEVFSSSVAAVAAFLQASDKYDLVITDMTMPEMDGGELAQKIHTAKADTPIILCTGFSEVLAEERLEELGIKGYLMKPFVMRDLAGIVRRVLEGASL